MRSETAASISVLVWGLLGVCRASATLASVGDEVLLAVKYHLKHSHVGGPSFGVVRVVSLCVPASFADACSIAERPNQGTR
jgi:hypothetical protein